MPTLHPCPNDDGLPVTLHKPSMPTGLAAWADPGAIATVIPGGAMPAALNGIAFDAWAGVAPGEWAGLAGDADEPEPAFALPAGLMAAAGAVIVEDDGRVWLVAPSNGYGGYAATFPKGRVDAGTSLRCAAVREAFEESGLKVAIGAFLVDVRRTLTYTRYYLARRIGGHPGRMGWESQAVHLVPPHLLGQVATNGNDLAIIAALARSR